MTSQDTIKPYKSERLGVTCCSDGLVKTYWVKDDFICDNVSYCHDPIVVGEDDRVVRVYCKQCHEIIPIYKDWRGVVNNKQYSEVFRRDILQGNNPLFYKYYPQYLRT